MPNVVNKYISSQKGLNYAQVEQTKLKF